jgi:hypothetical protein
MSKAAINAAIGNPVLVPGTRISGIATSRRCLAAFQLYPVRSDPAHVGLGFIRVDSAMSESNGDAIAIADDQHSESILTEIRARARVSWGLTLWGLWPLRLYFHDN